MLCLAYIVFYFRTKTRGEIMKKIKLTEFKLLKKLIKQGRYEEAVHWAHVIDGHYSTDPGRQLASGGSCDDTDVSYFGIVYYPQSDPWCPETLLEAYYDPTTEEFFDVSGRWA